MRTIGYNDVLRQIIDGGIAGAQDDYGDEKHCYQLLGSVDGFEVCRDKQPNELVKLLQAARDRQQQAFRDRAEDYWYHRCYAAEIEWVCNCVSVMLMNAGLTTIVPPTARALMQTAEIVGVRET